MVQLTADAKNIPFAPKTVLRGFAPAIVLEWLQSPIENCWLRDWTEVSHPDKLVVSGILHFACFYNEATKLLDIIRGEISEKDRRRPFFTADSFQVEITFPVNSIPIIKETGGRIDQLARSRRMISYELHTNPDGGCCLTYYQSLRGLTTDIAGMRDYFTGFVIPFFYSRSGEERKMQIPGWGEYGHGLLGILEYYCEEMDKITDVDFQNVLRDLSESVHRNPTVRPGGSHKYNPRLWHYIAGHKKIKFRHIYYRDNFTDAKKKKLLLSPKHCLSLKMMAKRYKQLGNNF